MTPAEFRDTLERLGLGVNEFARLIDTDPRRVRRWATDGDDGPSPIAAAFLRYMLNASTAIGALEGYVTGHIQEWREHFRGMTRGDL